MHKNGLAIILATLSYSFLFYQQQAGLNFLLFTLLLITLLIWIDTALLKDKFFLLHASLSVLSAVFIVMYGSSLAITGNCIALLLLSAARVRNRSSVIFNLFFSLYSVT